MLIVLGGVIKSSRVQVQIYSLLEHGEMDTVSGIVLHQTSSDSVVKTMAEYTFRPSGAGAHFLINPAGQIFQTARINQVCWHVGRIKSYCKQMHRCAPADEAALANIFKKFSNNKDEYDRQIDALERAKSAINRFPNNSDSIGIEVVGAPKGNIYGSPTDAQNASSRWLVRELIETLRFGADRIFAHGFIDPRKQPSEGTLVKY